MADFWFFKSLQILFSDALNSENDTQLQACIAVIFFSLDLDDLTPIDLNDS